MKMSKYLGSLIILSGFITFSSCSKYEEGPFVSLRSKKARVVNTWTVEKYEVNGVDKTAGSVYSLENSYTFNSDYTYEILTQQKPFSGSGPNYGERETGTWFFDEDKENLMLKDNYSTGAGVFKILRLTNDELWTESTVRNYSQGSGSSKIVFHFKSKEEN